MLAIKIENLIKQYNNGIKAINDFNLKVNTGDIFTLLGPNGAGKSSLINILTTYYKPSSGSVSILGKDLCKKPDWVRTKIACVAQHVSIDEHLSLRENMKFQSRLYKIDKQLAEERINSLIDNFELSRYVNYPVASYSGGVKRRLDIAMNMVSSPKILFLDEPTVGMDVESRKAMWKLLLKLKEQYGITIFLTTHYLEEAEYLSDSICIMKDGKNIAQGSPSSLRNYLRQNIIHIKFSDNDLTKKNIGVIDKFELVQSTNIRGNSIFVKADSDRNAFLAVNRWLLDHQVKFEGIEVVEPSLEDVFLSLTGSEEKREEAPVC